ncbi:MAG: LiaI-LiaF-like domain-containing protein [Chloroflexota bacterium]
MSRPYPPPPDAPPPGYYRRRRRGGIVWPVLLMGAGVIFLLQNLGLLSWDVWGSIGRFWPAILILIGLELFLGSAGRHVLGAAMGGILALAIMAAIAVAAFGHFTSAGSGNFSSHTLTQALQGASAVHTVVRFGAGTLNLGALESQSDQLAQMTYDGPNQLTPRATYRIRNGQGQLNYDLRGNSPPWHIPFANGNAGNSQMDLLLNPQVPLSLDIQEGASEGKLDLTQLHVGNFDLQTGASHTTVIMPQNAGATVATIKGGAATIDVQVPDGVAAQIQYDGGLSTLNVDQNRFPSTGPRIYRSPDYDTAQNKLDLTIQAGVATISVR